MATLPLRLVIFTMLDLLFFFNIGKHKRLIIYGAVKFTAKVFLPIFKKIFAICFLKKFQHYLPKTFMEFFSFFNKFYNFFNFSCFL